MKHVNICSLSFLAILILLMFSRAESQIVDSEIQEKLKDVEKDFLLPNAENDVDVLREIGTDNENLLEQIKEMGETETDLETDETQEELADEKESDEDDAGDEDSEDEDELDLLTKDKEDDEEILLPFFIDELSNYKQSMIEYYRSISDFFGYHIFLQSIAEDPQESILPSSANKIIGPGDEVIITLWGDTKLRWKLKVENNGSIYIPLTELVYVHGLTLEEVENKLKTVLSKHFDTISPRDGSPPTTFFDVSFGDLRAVQVLVTGEVNKPGVHELTMSANLISALIKARGVKAEGTLRNIKIMRDDKLLRTVDLYDYLTTGKSNEDLNLKDNDNVFVGTRLSTVSLEGEILRPLKFEMTEEENLADLIRYAGGVTPTARVDKVQIERITPLDQRDNSVAYTYLLDYPMYIKTEEGKNRINPIKLYDRDIVKIESIKRLLTNYVSISGAVLAGGRYAFQQDMTIEDLIEKSGGLTADAHYERAELIRTRSDKTEEYVRLNLKESMDKSLLPTDSLNVFSIWDLKSPELVYIYGFVKRPGYYLLKDSMKVSDLIFTRGGLLDEWRKSRTYTLIAQLTRYDKDDITSHIIDVNIEKIIDGDKSEDIFLQNGDRLHIQSKYLENDLGKVTISGYVKKEGEYRLDTGMKVEDLIYRAHGFREGAFEEKAIVFSINKDEDIDDLSLVNEVPIAKDYFRKPDIPKSDYVLKHNDHVIIRKDPMYKYPRKVTISGEVKFPGTYSLTTLNETFNDLIKKAGGLTQEAFIEGTYLSRDTLRVVSDFEKVISSKGKYDIILKEGDDINIPKRPGTVLVEGYVNTPGLIKYRKDWGLLDYIEAAGGEVVHSEFYAAQPVLYYPGGNAVVANGWFYTPKVKEGSVIKLNRVRKQTDRNWIGELRAWLAVLTSTITILVLIEKL